jgi:hypothetical protein
VKASGLLLAVAMVLVAAPAESELRDTTVSEPQIGFAFDIPRDYDVRRMADGPGRSIAGSFDVTEKSGGSVLEVESESFRRLSGPADMLSYVKAGAMEYCNYIGPGHSMSADSITSLRRYRNAGGYQVFEMVVRVADFPSGDFDVEDSAPEADSARVAQPDTTGVHFFIVGPIYAVDLSRPGAPLVVWVRPYCDPFGDDRYSERAKSEARAVGLGICHTLRRLKT